ncbi:hypothetical protein I41_01420 [Lacipirellula limnantheis]|uniref:Uncharacterized protein n=1 Tax=Lacipirellula limnantheis TaxID=2528024 RepID=A0A517TRI7_9BACT|nr:hypothetical protein I41_01420 [Lacipirellula limnantheis]
MWYRWNVHRSAESRIAGPAWKLIEFERLPADAPELNPVVAMWSHAKYAKLANYVPDDADGLDVAVRASLSDQTRNIRLTRSYFKTARLRIQTGSLALQPSIVQVPALTMREKTLRPVPRAIDDRQSVDGSLSVNETATKCFTPAAARGNARLLGDAGSASES